MQRSQIAEVIDARFADIKKDTHKIQGHFNHELLHHVRVEIKRLRSFLKLLRTEPGSSDMLKVRRRLKAFYGYIGIIRNIQLQQQLITGLVNEDLADIGMYMHHLHTESEEWKKDVINLIRDHEDFDEERDIILASLPQKLSKISVRKFVTKKVEAIEGFLILRQAQENNLHALRGVMKDILYNWSYVKAASDILPFEMSTIEKLQALTTILGNYGNLCSALDYLQPGYIEPVNDTNGQKLLCMARLEVEERCNKVRREFFSSLLNLRENFYTS